jgi:hypothetical protein
MAKQRQRHPKRVVSLLGSGQKKPNFVAFTFRFDTVVDHIVLATGLSQAFDPTQYSSFDPALHPEQSPFPIIQKQALWDTGATRSVITTATARELNLIPVGVATVNHVGGTRMSNRYMVNFFLPNKLYVTGVLVTECEDIAGNFGAIIGMDIITMGDFAITNVNRQTWVSFRFPSTKTVDYVEEFNNFEGKS